MSDNANETTRDVFDDSGADDSGENDNQTAGAGQDASQGAAANDSVDGGQKTDDKTGEENASGTPPEGQNDQEEIVDAKTGQKMIPEHRFKAALKEVTDKLDAATEELQKYTAIPVPDKETDPEGHDLHVRMKASSDVMREMRPDYQEVINHYAKMAESNPLLNQAVAADPLPAKLAYDIAKKDLELKELAGLRESDDWKKFQEWKKTQTTSATPPTQQAALNETVTRGLKAVPNLNRSTNASPNRNVRKGDTADDDLFRGAL